MENCIKKETVQNYNGAQIPWDLFVEGESYQNALELGCGTGQSSIKLAKNYKRLYTSDLSFENLSKLKERIGNLNLYNIYCFCGGDSPAIPFKDSMFDIVFLNEDVSRSMNSSSLSEILRVLKTGGTLYFSIKNVLSYKRLLSFKKNRGVLSLFEHKRLLKREGFSKTTHISLFPDNVEIREIQAFDYSSFQYKKLFPIFRGLKNLKSFIKELKIFREFAAPGFGVFSKKEDLFQHTIDDIIDSIKTWSNIDSWEVLKPVFEITQKGSFVFKLGNRKTELRMIVKIPLNTASSKQLEQNFSQMSLLYKRCSISHGLKQIIPEPFVGETCNRYRYFAEELKEGEPAALFCDSPEKFSTILKNAVKKIILLHSETKVYGERAESNLRKILNNKIDRLHLLLATVEKENINKLNDYLEKQLLSESLPAIFHKGDCSAHNILVSKTYSISAFIDWDNSLEYGYPLLDLINLVESFKRHSERLGMGDVMNKFLLPMNLSALEKEMFSLYCSEMEIPEKLIFPMCILYWLDHITGQDLAHDPKWMENNAFRVWNYLKKVI